MPFRTPGETAPTAECLLDRIQEVRRYLRRQGFSDNAIEHAVTVVYCVAMPYVIGTKTCAINNRRAWVFRVAIRAAIRASRREVDRATIEPAALAATMKHPARREGQWDIGDALKPLTKQQIEAVIFCILCDMSQRAAAKKMGIAVGTLCGHLSAAKERLKDILPPLMSSRLAKHYDPGARASNTVEVEILPLQNLVAGTASNGCESDEEVA
jgi:DNA-directed RNA polymerase specialized sigma24 family protein